MIQRDRRDLANPPAGRDPSITSYEATPNPLAPGDRLDRYELLCILAQGGMGTVWLARMSGKLGFERIVAVKTILPMYSNDRNFGAMFLDEARIAARIDHENVARILEIGEDRGLLFYAMELIDGESVRKLYRDIRGQDAMFPLGVALRIAADACAGLHATHELTGDDGRPLEVVHRDVSPQNLLLSVRGTVKLIDFGVAKARSRNTEETAAGTLKGKLEYMAPEQARGDRMDRRADIYSVGALLYELLAGRPVRDTDDGRQLAALHELITGAPYQSLPMEIPTLVRQIVDRALARDPERRFPTAEAFRRALEQAMQATGQTATSDDVAAVLAHYSGERTQKRRAAIEEAVRRTDEARQSETVVAHQLPMMPQQGATRVTAPQHHLSPMFPQALASPRAGHTGHGNPNMTGPFQVPGSGYVLGPEPVTGPSMRTVGGASYSAVPHGPPPAGGTASRVLAGIMAVCLVGLLGGVAGMYFTKRQQQQLAVPPVEATTVPVPVVSSTASAATPTPPVTGVVAIAEEPPTVKDAGAPSTTTGRGGSQGGGRRGGSTPTTATSGNGPRHIGGQKPWAGGEGDDYGF